MSRGNVAPCSGKVCTCDVCGLLFRTTNDKLRAMPHVCAAKRQPQPRGLGDLVAAGLASVGITKERAQAVANAVGVKDCGCAKRQQALNELGRRIGIG